MTAQCKVLHLLFSQSDYPKIVECSVIQSVWVFVFIGLLPDRVAVYRLSTVYGNGLSVNSMPSSSKKEARNIHLEFSLSEAQGTYTVLLTLSPFR